jgi:hypothetical protein
MNLRKQYERHEGYEGGRGAHITGVRLSAAPRKPSLSESPQSQNEKASFPSFASVRFRQIDSCNLSHRFPLERVEAKARDAGPAGGRCGHQLP